MRKITAQIAALVAFVLFAIGLTAGAAQARSKSVIGPVTVCSVITFFDFVIFEHNCETYEYP